MVGTIGAAVAFWAIAQASAESNGRVLQPSFHYEIVDLTGVPTASVDEAAATVARLFEPHGVAAIRVDRSRVPAGSAGVSASCPPPIQVVLSATSVFKIFAGGSSTALGATRLAADGTGRVSHVSFARVRQAAAHSAIPVGMLLGYVIAHEVGHVLLPDGAWHTLVGIMSAVWTPDQYKAIAQGQLTFSREQGRSIRATLAAPAPVNVDGGTNPRHLPDRLQWACSPPVRSGATPR